MVNVRVLSLASVTTIGLFWGCSSTNRNPSEVINHDSGAGQWELTIAYANEALEKDPDDDEAYFQLGLAYSFFDSVEVAYGYLMKSVELEPQRRELAENNIASNYASHYNNGLRAEGTKDYLGAIVEYKKASAADPRRWKAHYKVAMNYLELGDQEEARKCLKRALERSDDKSRSKIQEALDDLEESS